MSNINPKVFKFFRTLAKNNNRDWFEAHKPEFKALEVEVKIFMKAVEDNLQIHDKIEKAKMFRIYRDVRFSKNSLLPVFLIKTKFSILIPNLFSK